MNRTSIQLSKTKTRNIDGLVQTGTNAAFCDAVRVSMGKETLLYISGQTPIDDNGFLVGKTMAEQTRQVLSRIENILKHEGATMDNVVRVRVYTTDISPQSLGQIHATRNEFFNSENLPASTLVEISGISRKGAMIEIDAEAVIFEK